MQEKISFNQVYQFNGDLQHCIILFCKRLSHHLHIDNDDNDSNIDNDNDNDNNNNKKKKKKKKNQ